MSPNESIGSFRAGRQGNAVLIPFLLVVLVVAIGGCQTPAQLQNRPDADFFTGVGGMKLDFQTAAPPDEIYEGSEASVGLVIQNDGPVDVPLRGQGAARLSYSVDPFYLQVGNVQPLGTDYANQPSVMPGRSRGYPAGGEVVLEYLRLNATVVQGTRQIPTTQVFVNLCYPYQTILDTEYCIDVSTVYPSDRPQACSGKDLAFEGQGSPIAITSIQSEMLPVQAPGRPAGEGFIKPLFRITMSNKGTGTLLGPDTTEADMVNACSLQTQNPKNWDSVRVSASLLGQQLECTPSVIRFIDNVGFTRCTFPAGANAIGAQTNYMTQMHVELSYVYLQTVSKTVTIRRTEVFVPDPTMPQPACAKEEVNIGTTQNPICEPLCTFCIRNPGAQGCSRDMPYTRYANFEWNDSLRCGCNADQCFDKEKVGKCIFGKCAVNYCCRE